MYFNILDEGEQQPKAAADRITDLQDRILRLMKESQDPAFTQYLRQLQNCVQDEENRIADMGANLDKQYQVYLRNMQRRATPPVQQMASTQQTLPRQEAQQVNQPYFQAQPVARNAEFAIGGAVLGIVGSAFILIAMVLLGWYYMEGVMKGLIMYAACIMVMVLSEVVLYRRWPRLGMLFSAIGMAGLYVSTVVNYWALGNFNEWVALAVTICITVFIIWLSRRRDAALYRILGMVCLYCCFYLALHEKSMAGTIAPAELVTLSIMMLVINIMCLAVPVSKGRTVVDVTHMSVNTFFAYMVYGGLFDATAQTQKLFSDVWHYLFFLAVSILVMQMIYIVQLRYKARISQGIAQVIGPVIGENVGICTTYGISALIYVSLIFRIAGYKLALNDVLSDSGWLYRLICAETIFILCAITLFALGKSQEKWLAWYLMNFAILAIYYNAEKNVEIYAALLILLIVGKLISYAGSWLPRICDMIITVLACGAVGVAYDQKWAVLLFAGIVVSVLFINHWKTYYEIITAYTIAWYIAANMLPILRLPVFVGILFVWMLIFNNVKRFHGEGIVVFHACALAGQTICYMLLLNPVYRNAYLTYLCMLIFGIAIITVCFQKQYHLDFEGKPLIFAIFLTYMSLIVYTGYAIVNSILLMLTALACVGVGFYIRSKALRIYGLVLSLLVCGKLVLYDFAGSNSLQRMLVFFVVGVIALAMASIYIILEKHVEKNMEIIQSQKESTQI